MSDFEQEMQGGKILPAFFVEPTTVGEEFAVGELPAHMAYSAPVTGEYTALHTQWLRRYMDRARPFSAIVGLEDTRASNEEVRVNEVLSNNALLATHRAMLAAFRYVTHDASARMPYTPRLIVPGRQPHVETGAIIEVTGLSIAELAPRESTWRIMAKISLGEAAPQQTDARIVNLERIS